VYLGSAFLRFFTLLPFRRINNLRAFNVAFSSIPTAPTNIFFFNCDLQICKGALSSRYLRWQHQAHDVAVCFSQGVRNCMLVNTLFFTAANFESQKVALVTCRMRNRSRIFCTFMFVVRCQF